MTDQRPEITPTKPITATIPTAKRWHWLALLLPAVLVFSLDQSAKGWALTHLEFGQSVTPIPALADIFQITLSANRGAAFSLLPQLGDIFLLLALVMIVGIVVFYPRLQTSSWLERMCLGIVLGGVCSNALDRLRFGYVIDFFHVILRPVVSNVSNFADHAIVVGMIVLLITQWKGPSQPDKTAPHDFS